MAPRQATERRATGLARRTGAGNATSARTVSPGPATASARARDDGSRSSRATSSASGAPAKPSAQRTICVFGIGMVIPRPTKKSVTKKPPLLLNAHLDVVEADGTIRVPDALRPYMGGLEAIAPK